MELNDFLRETQASVRSQTQSGDAAQYDELVFADIVMKHMDDAGLTSAPSVCYYDGKIGGKALRLCGYALSEDETQLNLFSTIYFGADGVTPVSDEAVNRAARSCLRFLQCCEDGSLEKHLDPSSEVCTLAKKLKNIYDGLDQVRVFVLSDGVASTRMFKGRIIADKLVRVEVMDIERLHQHVAQGRGRDELTANFMELAGRPLPCVYIRGENEEYDYALTAMPGHVLQHLYEKFGVRLLEANVRSFLGTRSSTGVNADIRKTLLEAPERFMAYNNGLVIVADEVQVQRSEDGGSGIASMKGFQIVNGGQTTASMYFTGRKYPDAQLNKARVCTKIIVVRETEAVSVEGLIGDVSRCANRQNAVRQSDLSANHPFHKEMEKLSRTIYCPDGVGQWFYERVAGSYNTLLEREGTTRARLKALKDAIPAARRLNKTDLARYLVVWDCHRPDIASNGQQACFAFFMSEIGEQRKNNVTAADFKTMLAKAIIYRSVQDLVRRNYRTAMMQIANYTVTVASRLIGERLNFDLIWQNQGVSRELLAQFEMWAGQVREALYKSADGKAILSWSHNAKCREDVLTEHYIPAGAWIPEIE